MFESWVVMLRTGKIALNTFKNIHLQSNIFESPKEGTGRWRGGCSRAPSPGAAGALGTCQWHPLTASFRATDLASGPWTSLPGHRPCFRATVPLTFYKGKRKAGSTFKQSRATTVEFTLKLTQKLEQAPS